MQMLRFPGVALIIIAVVVSLMAGCGGGGGTTPITPITPITPTTDVTATGKVVSSLDSTRGVAGVTITYGAAYATTDSTGAFTLTFSPTVAELPYFFAVDTSGAGSAYPTTLTVVLANGQIYDPNEVDIPLGVLNGTASVLSTITVQQVTADDPGLPPYAKHNGMVYGRVVKESDGSAVVNATVKLGSPSSPALTVMTGARGYFAFDLGYENLLEDVVGTTRTFSVDLTTVTGLDGTYQITYGSGTYYQNQAVTIPDNTETIGVITVDDESNGGSNEPPPPPSS
jgi:hypothetical protein